MAGISRFGTGSAGRARIVSGFGTRRPVTRPAPRAVTSARPVSVMPKADFRAHYDPSRVIDLDRLKIVQDMRAPRESADDRGDTSTGDNGVMSPSESAGGGRGMPGTTLAPTTEKMGGGGLALAAVAAYLLLGG